jgi:hypothetical protein
VLAIDFMLFIGLMRYRSDNCLFITTSFVHVPTDLTATKIDYSASSYITSQSVQTYAHCGCRLTHRLVMSTRLLSLVVMSALFPVQW